MIAVMRQLGGVEPRECTLCGHMGRFEALGHPPRYDAQCPACGSRERHRLFGLLLQKLPELGRGLRVVHFAPEPAISRELRTRAGRYQTADLLMEGCDLRLNVEAIALPDASVDLFVLNHVLEHVDDRSALAELHRCLVEGGTAILSMPVIEGWNTTYENPVVAKGGSQRLRTLHFGWPDHLRYYGSDVRERIRRAGFELSEFHADGEETARYGLIPGERIFLARKN